MRFISLFLAALVLGLVLIACNSKDANKLKGQLVNGASPAPTAPAPPNDGVRRITTDELRDALAKGTAIVVDVRSEAAYKEGHIKGARFIPTTEILAKANELPKDKLIVTYCS
jgi:3-mercaptopyruvate sulfurtransferase SseA